MTSSRVIDCGSINRMFSEAADAVTKTADGLASSKVNRLCEGFIHDTWKAESELLDDKVSVLDRIDDLRKCVDLLERHETLLRGLHEHYLSLCASEVNKSIEVGCLSVERFDKLHRAYDEHDFKSKLVRDFIMEVRPLFFDDSDPVYKKFNCVDLKFDESEYADYIDLTFSDGDKEFSICVPVKGSVGLSRHRDAVHGFFHLKCVDVPDRKPSSRCKVLNGEAFKLIVNPQTLTTEVRKEEFDLLASHDPAAIRERLRAYLKDGDRTEFDYRSLWPYQMRKYHGVGEFDGLGELYCNDRQYYSMNTY